MDLKDPPKCEADPTRREVCKGHGARRGGEPKSRLAFEKTDYHCPDIRPHPQGMMSEFLRLAWGLKEVGPALDTISGEQLAECVFITGKEVRPQRRSRLGLALEHTIRLLLGAHDEPVLHREIGPDPPLVTLERVINLYLTPRPLLSADQ